MKPNSIRNLLTLESRIRLSLLHIFAKRYASSNPGSKTQVIGFENRPFLKVTPSQDASDRRVQSYNFIEAVQKLPTNFSKEELKMTLDQVRGQTRLTGKLKLLFVVISDDMITRGPRAAKAGEGPKPSTEADASNPRKRGPTGPAVSGKNKNKNQRK